MVALPHSPALANLANDPAIVRFFTTPLTPTVANRGQMLPFAVIVLPFPSNVPSKVPLAYSK